MSEKPMSEPIAMEVQDMKYMAIWRDPSGKVYETKHPDMKDFGTHLMAKVNYTTHVLVGVVSI